MKKVFYPNRSLQATAALIVISALISEVLLAIYGGPEAYIIILVLVSSFPVLTGAFGFMLFFRSSSYVTLTDREIIVHQWNIYTRGNGSV